MNFWSFAANRATSTSPSTDSASKWARWWICSMSLVVAPASLWSSAAAPATSWTLSAQLSPPSLLSHFPTCDQSETERAVILEKFRQAALSWNQNLSAPESGDDCEAGKDENISYMIVVTDACLPLLSSGESPISARVLINYELPTKKETYMRRMASCLATDGVIINMVVGGEVVTLKSVEESSSLVIAEMPINISEIL